MLWRKVSLLASVVAAVTGVVTAGATPGSAATLPLTGGTSVTLSAPTAAATPRHLFVPDLFAAAPAGLTGSQVEAVRKLPGVRGVLPVDGGKIEVDGQTADTIGVSPRRFRSWTPPATAAEQPLWTALSRGEIVPSAATADRIHLTAGDRYPVTGARRAELTDGGSADLGIPGVDAVVTGSVARTLGLVPDLGVLVNAPGVDLATLARQVRGALGTRGRAVRLKPTVTTVPAAAHPATGLPVNDTVPAGTPTSYLALYKASAARYCPGLSWTVLAAIGDVESGNGANMGPSSAGALGPMQFLPATWQQWGIDAFGQRGPPNILDPLDAVPSAAVYLCAFGAAGGGSSLAGAIFAYNHADWYVNEVLSIANEYARSYG